MQYLKAILWHGASAATFRHDGVLQNGVSRGNFYLITIIAAAMVFIVDGVSVSFTSAIIASALQVFFLLMMSSFYGVSLATIIACMEIFYLCIRMIIVLAAPAIYEDSKSALMILFLASVFVLSKRASENQPRKR